VSDRFKGLTVIFEHDIHEDCIPEIMVAINMIKGVKDVQSHKTTPEDKINREMLRMDYRKQMIEAIWSIFDNPSNDK